MTNRDPLQVVILLDAAAGVSAKDVEDVLPEYDRRPRFHRLSEHVLGDLGLGSTVSSLEKQSRAVHSLANEFLSQHGSDRDVELYIAGNAPLPLFVQLGYELRTWTQRLLFLWQTPERNWEVLQIPPTGNGSSKNFSQRIFQRRTSDNSGSDQMLDVYVSMRGGEPNLAPVERFHRANGTATPNREELFSSVFISITQANVDQAAEELQRFSKQRLRGSDLTVFLHGTPVLAFLLGRTLELGGHRVSVPLRDGREFLPALQFPVEVRPAAPEKLTVCVVYPPSAAESATELQKHLRAGGRSGHLGLAVFDLTNGVPAGGVFEQERDKMLRKSDILVTLLNVDFFSLEDPPLRDLVRRFRKLNLGPEIPVLEGPFPGLDGYLRRQWKTEPSVGPEIDAASLPDDYEYRQLLPRNGSPLRAQRDLDQALSAVASEVLAEGTKLIEGRRQQEQVGVRPQRLGSISAQKPSTVSECLDSIERDFSRLPLLGCAEDERCWIWKRLADFLNKTDAPLQDVLDRLEPKDAERWLVLGATGASPRIPFPHWNSPKQDLVSKLNSFSAVDLDLKERAEQSQLLFDQQSPALRALMSNHHIESREELELAARLLGELRSNEPFFTPLPEDRSQIRFVGLLTVVAARWFFCGDLRRAETAYREALRRAQVDENVLAEWVAIRGVILSIRNQSLPERLPEASELEARVEELERTPIVKYVREYRQAAHSEAVSGMVDRLQSKLDTEQITMHVGSPALSLDVVLRDQEELGEPPILCGETANHIGKVCLLGADTSNVRYAIQLLCRYGIRASGNRDFFSTALSYSFPQREEVFKPVLHRGRTEGEDLARLEFLRRHLSELPPNLVSEAWGFFSRLLDRFLPVAQQGQRVSYLKGSEYIASSAEYIVESIVEQASRLAGLARGGPELLLDLLGRPGEQVWLRTLSLFHLKAWERWLALGELPSDCLQALASKLNERLDAVASKSPVSTFGRGADSRFWIANIPLGLACFLSVLSKAQVSPSLIEALHRHLCQWLTDGTAQLPSYSLPTILAQPIVSWLNSREDPETQRFVDGQLERLFTGLESSKQIDGDRWESLSACVQFLRSAHWERLLRLVQRDRDALQKMASSSQHGRALAWLATALVNQDHSEPLQQEGLSLLRAGMKEPTSLIAAVSANPKRIGNEAEALEQAVLKRVRSQSEPRWPDRKFGATYNRLYFHADIEPCCGWRRWIDPVLHRLFACDQPQQDLIVALRILDLSLSRIPTYVDQSLALDALCFLLSHAPGQVREEALYVAVRHRSLLESIDAVLLAEALKRFDPPPSIAVDSALRQARLPEPLG